MYFTEDDRVGHRGLDEALLARAREQGLAGASVWRGTGGFGAAGHIRTGRFPDSLAGLPLAFEAVDSPGRIEAFLDAVWHLARGCLVTRQQVYVIGAGKS